MPVDTDRYQGLLRLESPANKGRRVTILSSEEGANLYNWREAVVEGRHGPLVTVRIVNEQTIFGGNLVGLRRADLLDGWRTIRFDGTQVTKCP